MPVTQSPLVFESGGKSIRLAAYLPEKTDGSIPVSGIPAVVALHGAGGNVGGMERYASALAARGFAVYLLHYFDRTGPQPEDLSTMKRHFPVWMKTLWDAISFVEKQPLVDRQRIALIGFSLGAYLSLANSAIDPRVKAVVEFFGGMPREMHLFMRRLCPVLILHGEGDPTVPVAEAYELQKLLEKKHIPYEIKIYSGAGHGFDSDVWKDAGERSLNFLLKYLAAGESE